MYDFSFTITYTRGCNEYVNVFVEHKSPRSEAIYACMEPTERWVLESVTGDQSEFAAAEDRLLDASLDRYSICDDRGYLVDVLQPIIDARDGIKAAIRHKTERDDPDEDRLAELEGRSGALKWILVACFGYQGFSNAIFGRIECHEAINAFAREILLTAKQRLEAGGWRVVHGIVDSIWVTPAPDVDDEKSSRDRVALAHEAIETYDASYYETQLVRAVESVLAPLGWDRMEIRREIAETRETDMAAFTEIERG